MIDVGEAARVLGVPKTWFYNGSAARAGVPVYKFGRYLRVKPEELFAYIEGSKVG